MKNYLKPDVVSRAQALGLKARLLVEGLRVGDHKSPYRGFSVEFVQHREYVPGDDIRHIDWKGYGRSERYTIKQYEQETNYIGHILLDTSKSMLYGEGATNKLEYAKFLAATLAHLIIQKRDMVSFAAFDEGWRSRLPASSQIGHLQTIFHTMESLEPKDKTAMAPLLHDLAQEAKRRGLVFLISDCFDEVEPLLDGLRHLCFEGHEVTVFHVLHPDELDFPFNGMVKFDGMEDGRKYLTRPQLIRPAYLRALKKYMEELQRGCERNRVDYVQMNTGRPLAESLVEYLAQRQRMKLIG